MLADAAAFISVLDLADQKYTSLAAAGSTAIRSRSSGKSVAAARFEVTRADATVS